MAKLTAKQKAFCEYYCACNDAKEAAIKAGYSKKTAKVIGSQNLTKLNLAEYIQELRNTTALEIKFTKLAWLAQLQRNSDKAFTRKKIQDSTNALKEIGKALGYYPDPTLDLNINIPTVINFSWATDGDTSEVSDDD